MDGFADQNKDKTMYKYYTKAPAFICINSTWKGIGNGILFLLNFDRMDYVWREQKMPLKQRVTQGKYINACQYGCLLKI